MIVLTKKYRACILAIILWINALYPNFSISGVNTQGSSSQKNKELVKILKSNTIVGYTISYLLELQDNNPELIPELINDREKFVTVMEDLYNKNPSNKKIALLYACILADTDRIIKANDVINRIKEPDELGNLFYCYNAKIAAKMGDLEKAESSFRHIKHPHDDPDVWHLEGLLNANKGAEKKALSIWEALTKKYPEHGLTYYDLGVAYTIFNEYDKAIDNFEKAWKYLNKNYKKEKQKAHLQQAYIEIIIFKNKENGVKHLQEAIELDPGSPELKEFCDKIGFKMPNIVENNTKLDEAYTLIEKRDYTKAENIISFVLGNDKNNPKAMWYLAYLKYSQEKYPEAIELF